MALRRNKTAEAWKRAAEDWEEAYHRSQELLQEVLPMLPEDAPQKTKIEMEHLVNPGLLYF